MAEHLPVGAKLLVSEADITSAISRLAEQLNARFLTCAEPVVALTVMNGGLVFAGQLIPQLRFPLICDYLHATRYDNANATRELTWRAKPSVTLQGRSVLVLDDILDQGITCAAIKTFCEARGASSIDFVMLAAKPVSCRKVDIEANYVGLSIPDEFVFGMGMDYSGLYRNLPAIYFKAEQG